MLIVTKQVNILRNLIIKQFTYFTGDDGSNTDFSVPQEQATATLVAEDAVELWQSLGLLSQKTLLGFKHSDKAMLTQTACESFEAFCAHLNKLEKGFNCQTTCKKV